MREQRAVVGERRDADGEVVLAGPVRRLAARPLLAVELARLPSDRERHADRGHQVALVGRVHEDGGFVRFRQRRHERGRECGLDPGALQHPLEQALGDVRLRALHAPERHAVVVGHGRVEAAREAAEDLRVADVRPREAPGDHAADMRLRREKPRARACLRRGDRGGDPRRRRPVDEDVGHAVAQATAASKRARPCGPSSHGSSASGARKIATRRAGATLPGISAPAS